MTLETIELVVLAVVVSVKLVCTVHVVREYYRLTKR